MSSERISFGPGDPRLRAVGAGACDKRSRRDAPAAMRPPSLRLATANLTGDELRLTFTEQVTGDRVDRVFRRAR